MADIKIYEELAKEYLKDYSDEQLTKAIENADFDVEWYASYNSNRSLVEKLEAFVDNDEPLKLTRPEIIAFFTQYFEGTIESEFDYDFGRYL